MYPVPWMCIYTVRVHGETRFAANTDDLFITANVSLFHLKLLSWNANNYILSSQNGDYLFKYSHCIHWSYFDTLILIGKSPFSLNSVPLNFNFITK